MNAKIHSSSIVSPQAVLGNEVVIGPFCIIGAKTKIGNGSILRSHTIVGPNVTIGQHNDIYAHCVLGTDPQDIKFGESSTVLKIGDFNTIREHCTIHRGTEYGNNSTIIGNNNLFMTGTHIAHDCHVKNNNILANYTTLAGHVQIGSFCNIGAFTAIHQFCRIGSHAFMGGFTIATLDVLPYMKTVGARDVKCYGVNTLGLRRHKINEYTIKRLIIAYRILFHSNLTKNYAIEYIKTYFGDNTEVHYLTSFIRNSARGVHRG